ncbi:MAG: SAP domain-containing protein [Oscillospiraceae bacterium]|nr:SAP domain-containing protein [Oscillospiraceae bacterium]
MGLFSFFKPSAMGNVGGLGSVPHTADLLYPAPLVRFEELADGGHSDPRALYYAIRYISPHGKRPFSTDALSGLDFGRNSDALRLLVRLGYIREISAARSLAELYSKDELQAFLRERGLPVKGNKAQLSERLHKSGFCPTEKKRRRKQYELTDAGRALIEEHDADKSDIILDATLAIKQSDYSGAISAYRDYDSRWGFVHTSGKNHTIFAHYDVPFSRFDFLAHYSMRELQNSSDFRDALRACLIAGLMRGEQESVELAHCFREVCHEQIVCPNITHYFSMDDFDYGTAAAIRASMERNAAADSRCVLEYYISRILYMSRRA